VAGASRTPSSLAIGSDSGAGRSRSRRRTGVDPLDGGRAGRRCPRRPPGCQASRRARTATTVGGSAREAGGGRRRRRARAGRGASPPPHRDRRDARRCRRAQRGHVVAVPDLGFEPLQAYPLASKGPRKAAHRRASAVSLVDGVLTTLVYADGHASSTLVVRSHAYRVIEYSARWFRFTVSAWKTRTESSG
jgi:hypothetical protein